MVTLELQDFSGSRCPVRPAQLVVVKCRAPHLPLKAGRAGEFTWNKHLNYGDAVVAYAVINVEGEEQLADGFIIWSGGECPVPGDYRVRIKLRNGTVESKPCAAGAYVWHCNGAGDDIVAYQVVEDGRGFTPWAGGECPVDSDAMVIVRLRGGSEGKGRAGLYDWSVTDSVSDIVGYRLAPESGGFIDWEGGPPPVEDDLVEVVFRNGLSQIGIGFIWTVSGSDYDIIRYRVVQ